MNDYVNTSDEFFEKLYCNIKTIRRKRHLTQDDLAIKMGIYRENLSKIELGKVDIRVSTLWKLAYALEVEVQELLK